MSNQNLPKNQSTIKICSVEDCTQKHYGKGYCQKHYVRFQKYGDVYFLANKQVKICSVEDCQLNVNSRGYCRKHYTQLFYNNRKKTCSIEGCDHTLLAKGLCGKHYQRQTKHGDINYQSRKLGEGETVKERFWSLVAKTSNTTECWEWKGTALPENSVLPEKCLRSHEN